MRVIGLAGWSGAGKTTLLVRLVPELARRGVSVSTLKHAHHGFDVDTPGKDSYEHRQAGAREVLVASSRRYALIHELRDEPEPSLPDLLERLSPVDLVVVEGFKASAHPKLEVHRVANGRPLLYGQLPNVVGIVTDAEVTESGFTEDDLPLAGLDDIPAIADLVLAKAGVFADVVTLLRGAEPARSSAA